MGMQCVFYACGWQHYIAVVLPTKLLPVCLKCTTERPEIKYFPGGACPQTPLHGRGTPIHLTYLFNILRTGLAITVYHVRVGGGNCYNPCMYTIGHNTCEGLNLYMYKGYMDNASASPFLIDCVHGWAFFLCIFNLMEKLSHVCMLVQALHLWLVLLISYDSACWISLGNWHV